MNKLELLDDLRNKSFVFKFMGEPVLQREDIGYKWYTQEIFEKAGTAGNGRTIHFYVFDEGEPTERAFYKTRTPECDSRANIFKIKIQDKLNAISGKIEEINEDGQYAIVGGYIEVEGVMNPKRYLIKWDGTKITKTEIK